MLRPVGDRRTAIRCSIRQRRPQILTMAPVGDPRTTTRCTTRQRRPRIRPAVRTSLHSGIHDANRCCGTPMRSLDDDSRTALHWLLDDSDESFARTDRDGVRYMSDSETSADLPELHYAFAPEGWKPGRERPPGAPPPPPPPPPHPRPPHRAYHPPSEWHPDPEHPYITPDDIEPFEETGVPPPASVPPHRVVLVYPPPPREPTRKTEG